MKISNTHHKTKQGVVKRNPLKITKISDIPFLSQELLVGNVTYRGLGIGSLQKRFYEQTGQTGVRLRVKGKEYYITHIDFEKIGGHKKIRFDAPSKDEDMFSTKKELERWKSPQTNNVDFFSIR